MKTERFEANAHEQFDLSLEVEPQKVRPRDKVTFHWSTTADNVVLLHSPVAPLSPEPENWHSILQQGEVVDQKGEYETKAEDVSALYLVARKGSNIRAKKVIIEPIPDQEKQEANTWSPQQVFLPKFEDRSAIALVNLPAPALAERINPNLLRELSLNHTWSAGPTVSITVNESVIFADESTTLSWNVANASCVNMGSYHSSRDLVADPSQISGTRYGGGSWGAGGMPPCALGNGAGSQKITSQTTYGSAHHRTWILADSPAGSSVNVTKWIDILSTPSFTGNYANRENDIRNAIREIDLKLRSGCILTDNSLDSTVDAFKKGYLDRKEFWYRLIYEIQNMGLITFACHDVSEKDWGAGHWKDRTNEIILEWSPTKTPYLEYVILHELCHKAGFHSALLAHYSRLEVEQQAHLVSGACYP